MDADMNASMLRTRVVAVDDVARLKVFRARNLKLEAYGVIDVRETELDNAILHHNQHHDSL